MVLRQTGADVITVGTVAAFWPDRIWRGTADAAAIHLRHRPAATTAPSPARFSEGAARLIITCGARAGLLTPEDNPDHISDPGDLKALRVARRQFGVAPACCSTGS
jgi:hypothetical protein